MLFSAHGSNAKKAREQYKIKVGKTGGGHHLKWSVQFKHYNFGVCCIAIHCLRFEGGRGPSSE